MKTKPDFVTHILQKEAMNYKQQIKCNELLTKLRIIRLVINQRQTQTNVAQAFGCHRNTVGNLIKSFKKKFNQQEQRELLENKYNIEELNHNLDKLKSASPRPKRHPKQATIAQEQKIVEIFKKQRVGVGYQRLKRIITRKYYDNEDQLELSLSKITLGQMRGVYKRKRLKPEKKKSSTGEYKSLYDYQALACFERMHYDVKYLADKKMLPIEVYELFKNNSKLPQYQWSLIDVKSRFRFVAYSHNINSEFGLRLLLFCIQYIRTITNNWQTHIKIGVDNGSEFCSGSIRKEDLWNEYLSLLDASLYSYHAGHDVRKNLVERSHLDDDYEWLVPRGDRITSKKIFKQEAEEYFIYRNFNRSHSGKGMHGRTPIEVIRDSKVIGVNRLFTFPILILEDHIQSLREATDLFIYQQELNNLPEKYPDAPSHIISLKDKFELQPSYFFLKDFAQKVLTQDRLAKTASLLSLKNGLSL